MDGIEIDRSKIRNQLKTLSEDGLLVLLYRALDGVPDSRLPALIEGYISLEKVQTTGGQAGLLELVREFARASLCQAYVETYNVDWKNSTRMSRGTTTWIAQCNYFLDTCAAQAQEVPSAETREILEIIFALLRQIDKGNDDVIFFADEAGAWQVGVDWKKVLPVYFASLANTAGPEEYARLARGVVNDFDNHAPDLHLREARSAATPAQQEALEKDH